MTVADLGAKWQALWLPPERLTLSQWAEQHLVLSSEYSAVNGPIKLHQYQRAIFDAFTEPGVKEIVLMCGTQLVKSLLIQAIIAYTIAVDPLPILVIQPTESSARKFSRRRIAPMLRDCPALRGLVAASGAGKENTLQEKAFPGGSLTILGGGSPTNLASASIALLLVDEIDKLDADVGNHGDPIAQAQARLSTYGSRAKMVLVCSPTEEHTSKIAQRYQASDQREAYVPCHECGRFQTLRFSQVKWVKSDTKTAHYECENDQCKAQWNDLQRWRSCGRMEWRGQKPFEGIAGFHLSHLHSPWHKLSDIVKEFLRVKKDPLQFRTFVNNTLAEVYRTEGISPDEDKLFARREEYPFNDDAVIPKGGLFLTAAVDVQHDRLELEVVAWGRNKESWSIANYVIRAFAPEGKTPLPTTSPEVWAKLDRDILQREWTHKGGGKMAIMLMAIDCGYNPQSVYDFVLRHRQLDYSPSAGMTVGALRSVVPVRGTHDDFQIISAISTENAAKKRDNIRIVSIGSAVKTELYENLRNVKQSEDGTPVPNCLHFPFYKKDYFEGLCSENRILKPNGQYVWTKKPNVRNEPLDLKVYNRGAAELCGISSLPEHIWQRLEANVGCKPATPSGEPMQQHQQPQRRIRGRLF